MFSVGRERGRAHSGFGFFFVLQSTLAAVNIQLLPDKGERLLKQVQDLEAALSALNVSENTTEKGRAKLCGFLVFFPELYKTICLTIVVNTE